MFLRDWWNRRRFKKRAGIKVGIQVTTCKDCDKYNKAIEIYDLFNWQIAFKAIGYDKEKEEILLAEEQVLRIVQMVNPGQLPHRIRLVSQAEIWGSDKYDPF
jgi:hypothetical protein